MKLTQALSRIAELPKILEQHGIAPENVIKVECSASAIDNINVLVQLYHKESIEKLGTCDVEKTIGYDDACWTQYGIIKDGISFTCWESEGEGIA